MNKRSNIVEYLAKARRDFLVNKKFTDDLSIGVEEKCEKRMIDAALKEIYILIRNWSEGMDLASADTQRPTYYLDIFKLLFENSEKLTYKEISNKIGGANIEKFVRKCSGIAIAKAMKMNSENDIYKKILDKYYEWSGT